MTAYYNENDPYAAQWLRNLITAGHIAQGDVDERSIIDVRGSDLIGYTQCHFFAGIGVWSYALRLAGWPDDRPVWTGSCPCQPFSAAGKQQGTSDERHLWPAWFGLIEKCNPPVVFGEQVEAAIRHGWLDLVQADMEGIGYAVAAAGIPAAGVGAPHIRQRLWFVADAELSERRSGNFRSAIDVRQTCGRIEGADRIGERGNLGRLGHHHHPRLEGLRSGHQAEGGRDGAVRPVAEAGESGGVGDADSQRHAGQYTLLRSENDGRIATQGVSETAGASEAGRPSPTNGHWRNADWLHCRDGKWRPVEASPQSMVDGSAESLGRVRPEIVSKIEEEINAAAMENKVSAAEAVRALRDYLAATAGRQWQAGRVPGLHEAPFLLSFLRELTQQGWQFSQSLSLPSPQTAEWELRMLRIAEAAASPSHQRELEGQQPCKFTDTVHLLSSILARHAQAAWGHAHETYAEIGFPLGRNAPARVGRLRAYGNAIVPQVAAEVIAAFMEFRPC